MPTASATASLKLAYGFVPTPNQIRASATGANPNVIDLQVIVSNPSTSSIKVSQITIEIPTGEDTGRALSTSVNLPAPAFDTGSPWIISSAGDTVTIAPRSGHPSPVDVPIVFTLRGIQVNHKPGTVRITVTEFAPPAPKAIDGTSYSLLKQEANFPITSVTVTPAILNDRDLPVTLRWACSDQGKQYAYGLRASIDSVPRRVGAPAPPLSAAAVGLKNCDDASDCYTWQEGERGVRVPAVSQTTTFTLAAFRTDSPGHRTEVASASVTARIAVPWIADTSYAQPSVSGRLVWLHWLAFNAAYCSIELDTRTIVQRAPTNTYRNGYLVFMPETPGQFRFTVIAHAVSGTATVRFRFEPVTVGAPVTLPMDGRLAGPAVVTPDGTLALISKNVTTLLDLQAMQRPPTVIPTASYIEPFMRKIAVTPDSSLAFVSQNMKNSIAVIDLATRTVDPVEIALRAPRSIACTPDGSLVLVGSVFQNWTIAVIDVATRAIEPTRIPVQDSSGQIAITPDGTLALVGSDNAQRTAVSFIDIDARQAGAVLEVGPGPHDIGITSDGALALVVLPDGRVRVIDIDARAVEPEPISIGGAVTPGSLAITPDGQWAFIVSHGNLQLSLINIAARSCAPFATLDRPFSSWTAVSPTGSALMLLSMSPGTATLY